MTEADWLLQTHLTPMLYPLLLRRLKAFWTSWLGMKTSRLSDRKLRLFVCGCARQVWPYLSEPAQGVVELCERHADGLATESEVEEVRKALNSADVMVDYVARVAVASSPWFPFQIDLGGWGVDLAIRAARTLKGLTSDEDVDQCDLLRDVFVPYREISVDPSWTTWRDGLVKGMAQTIYDERRFDEMAILADALEETGCTDDVILEHCRTAKQHVRGCWVIDALLGRE